MMDKDIKILVISNMFPSSKYPSYGVFVENFCKQLTENNISFKLICMNKTQSKLYKVFRYIKFMLSAFVWCLFGKYDYIYIHYLSISSIPVLLASHFKELKVISNAHGSDFAPENKKQERCQKYTKHILRISEKIVVPSEYFKVYAQQKYGVELLNKKIYVYPSGGINKAIFYPMNETQIEYLHSKYNLEKGNIYYGYCGRISAQKGIDTLLKAAQLVLKKQKNIRFIIVGNGEYEKDMDLLINKLEIEQYIIRLPLLPQNQLAEIYNLINAFIFPTERDGESLGLVAIEAMACGNIVIASDYGAPKYYIEHGVNGYKFEKGNFEELASILLLLTNNDMIYKKMSYEALKTADAYTTQNTVKKMIKIFQEAYE